MIAYALKNKPVFGVPGMQKSLEMEEMASQRLYKGQYQMCVLYWHHNPSQQL